MTTATAAELQNNFGKYLHMVQTSDEVIVIKNGIEVARLVSYDKSISFLTDSLVGVLKGDYDDKEIRLEHMSNMKVLIDTNIILDVLCKRSGFYEDSAKVFDFHNCGFEGR